MSGTRDYTAIDCILAKRDGKPLDQDQIFWLIDAYVAGEVPDYQMSAFLMAVVLQGMDEEETLALTRSMIESGETIDLSDIPGPKIDKHSTGGVGDKISLVLAPLVAEMGLTVPMISGRSLGFSGGTLDKLESIPGFRADLSVTEFKSVLEETGVVITGQTEKLAPADRKIYALRDVTGTVECQALITASILSKKIASGIDKLVLDVKCGSGAFVQNRDEAVALSERLVNVAGLFGKEAVALLTSMDQPLGYGIGNWPEIVETIRALQGEEIPEVTELTVRLAGEMLALAGEKESWVSLGSLSQTRFGKAERRREEGEKRAREILRSGSAFERFCRLVAAQGGDTSQLEKPDQRLEFEPAYSVRVPPGVSGIVHSIHPRKIGRVSMALGAGRSAKEEPIDPLAGIRLNKKPGDAVQSGETLALMFTRKKEMCPALSRQVYDAFTIGDTLPDPHRLVYGRYHARRWSFY